MLSMRNSFSLPKKTFSQKNTNQPPKIPRKIVEYIFNAIINCESESYNHMTTAILVLSRFFLNIYLILGLN